MKSLLIAILFGLSIGRVLAVAYVSTNSGLWAAAATWTGNSGYPSANGDTWNIQAAHTVTYDANNTSNTPYGAGVLNGVLQITNQTNVVAMYQGGNITGTGNWYIGTAANPILSNPTQETVTIGVMNSPSWTISYPGSIRWYGERTNSSQKSATFLAQNAAMNTNVLVLTDDLDLRSNDVIIISSPACGALGTAAIVSNYNSGTKTVTLAPSWGWFEANKWGANLTSILYTGTPTYIRYAGTNAVGILSKSILVWRPGAVGYSWAPACTTNAIFQGVRNYNNNLANAETNWVFDYCSNVDGQLANNAHNFSIKHTIGYRLTFAPYSYRIIYDTCAHFNNYGGGSSAYGRCDVVNSYSTYLNCSSHNNGMNSAGWSSACYGAAYFSNCAAYFSSMGNAAVQGGTFAGNGGVAYFTKCLSFSNGAGGSFVSSAVGGAAYDCTNDAMQSTAALVKDSAGFRMVRPIRLGPNNSDVLYTNMNINDTAALFDPVVMYDSANTQAWYYVYGIISNQYSVLPYLGAVTAFVHTNNSTVAAYPVRYYVDGNVRANGKIRYNTWLRTENTNTAVTAQLTSANEDPLLVSTLLAAVTNTAAASTWQYKELTYQNPNNYPLDVKLWVTSTGTNSTSYSWVERGQDTTSTTLK